MRLSLSWLMIVPQSGQTVDVALDVFRYMALASIRNKSLIPHLKRRAVLGSGLALIIHARRGNIRVPQPELDLGNIRLMLQGIGGSGSAQVVHAHARDGLDEPDLSGVVPHDVAVDGGRIQ